MGFKKCPKCELNYIKDDEQLCNVCKRTAKHEPEPEEDLMCIECGEHPALKGRDLCAYCYKESLRQEQLADQRKGHNISEIDLDDVELKEVDVALPDEELPVDDMPDEFRDTSDDVKPNSETEEISLEAMGEEEDEEFDDEDEEIDEGFTPARRKFRK